MVAGGELYVVSDRSDFWSLYRVEGRGLDAGRPDRRPSSAGPLWQLGARWYDFIDADTVLAIATERGRSRLVRLDLATGADVEVELPFAEFAGVSCAGGQGGGAGPAETDPAPSSCSKRRARASRFSPARRARRRPGTDLPTPST